MTISEERLREFIDAAKMLSFSAYPAHGSGFVMVVTGNVERFQKALAAISEAHTGKGEDGWIEWKGGECPVDKKSVVEIRARDGRSWKPGAADTFQWQHSKAGHDIIAYRLVSPPQDWRSETVRWGELIDALRANQIPGLLRQNSILDALADHLARRRGG